MKKLIKKTNTKKKSMTKTIKIRIIKEKMISMLKLVKVKLILKILKEGFLIKYRKSIRKLLPLLITLSLRE
jgi:hypothetical protein